MRHNTAAALNEAIPVVAAPSRIAPSKWIEQNIMLPSEETAKPGLMSFDAYPYWRAVVDWIGDDDVQMIVVKKPAQVGWTTVISACVGYGIACDPCRILVAMATQNEAEIFSKDRFMPIVEASEPLKGKIRPAKSRDSNNTILHKKGPGFALKFAWAKSPNSMRSYPSKWVCCDEISSWDSNVGDEGDPIALIRKRIQTFLNQGGKMLLGSTPKLEGLCLVEKYYQQGTKAEWHCPCHHCGHEQDLDWDNVDYETDGDGKMLPETAAYRCCECGAVWDDIDRLANIRKGRIVEQDPEQEIKSISVKGLHSPHVTVVEIARKMAAAEGNPDDEQPVYNTDLGLTYRQPGEAPDAERLYERRENYPMGIVPPGGLILTAAADVQRDRIEVEVTAWGKGTESWSVEHIVLQGDVELDAVWRNLSAVVRQVWVNDKGAEFRLSRFGIDSGFATDRVYQWASKERDHRIRVLKGSKDEMTVPIRRVESKASKSKRKGVLLWQVGSGYCKSAIYSRLRLGKPEDGEPCPRYMHFPQYHREFFDQLCAELQSVETDNRGRTKRVWRQLRPRNEILDLKAYNFALMWEMGLENKPDRFWDELSGQAIAEIDEDESKKRVKTADSRVVRRRQATRSSILG